jgi:hypothetical protein
MVGAEFVVHGYAVGDAVKCVKRDFFQMTPERRTNIILLGLLAIIHLSTGVISRQLQGPEGWVVGVASIAYFAVMVIIYWRFNRDQASVLQLLSYWGIFCTFVITQRFGMIVDRTNLLEGGAVRLLIVVPIVLYAIASTDRE